MENITSKGTIFGTLIAQAGPKGDTGKTGDRGLTGEAGYSPIKGVDYFTQEDISEIRKGIEGDLTGEYNKNAIEKTNIFNTNAKETTTSFDLNAENKTKEYNDNALAEIEKYNSNAIEKSNNFDTNFENKTSKFDSNYDEKTKEFNDNNDLGIQNYNNNAKKQMEIFDTNFTEKLEAFNNNAGTKFNGFNTNSDKALAEYNKNHTTKMKEFDDNYDTKTKTFDDNAAAKLEAYNKNDEAKISTYNANDKAKTDAYNNNASNKEETFNTNAADKQNEFDENASDKLAEYNQNAKELINKVEQVQAENEALKAENKLIKEQIPSANASGNSVHIEDSSNLDFDWKINGGHAQEITTQSENYIDDREARGKTILEATSLYLPIVNLKAGNGYYFKLFDENNKIVQDSRYLAVEFYDVNKVKIQYQAFDFPSAFTEETAVKVKYAKIYYNGNDTDKVIGNTVIKKIGLKITSSVSADDIDMFVPDSPSLDYPSEIETVGSNVNDFDLISYYNTAPVVNATKQLLNNGIKLNFEARADAYIGTVLNEGETLNKNWRDGCVSVKPNTTYTIQINSAPKCYISYLDENYKAIKGFTQFFNNVTFTTDAHTHYFYFRFGYSNKTSDLTSYEFTNIKIEKGSIATPYSLYNQGSVEIDVINKNLYNGKNEIGGINNDGSLNNNADRWRAIDYINVENSTDISINIYNITTTGALGKYCLYDKNYNFLSSTQIININTVVNVSNVSYFRFWFLNDKVPTNTKIQVETGSTPATYAQNQSQTAIMPIQQEMLEGDYIKDVEHHEWQKFIFDGVTNRLNQKTGTSANNLYYTSYISNLLAPTSNGVKIEICSNCFKSYTANQLYGQDLVGVAVTTGKSFSIGFGLESSIDTLDKANEKLKELYDAGTPIIIYYKLAEAIDLELTSEQKAVREQKLYTYKNITNIDVSDELASIDVTYKKDLETEHDKLQNQIDEIKQLISTTETSALLLDNLQKDVEMEVE
jgi:hypothetical protein